MAIIEKFCVHNICQHKHVEMEVGPGLVVLTGHNGAGKTNLLNSVVGTLSNSYGELYGPKKGNIRRGVDREAAYSQAQWRLRGGSQFEVTRYLQRGTSMLSIDDHDTEIRGEDQITDRISELLGVPARSVRDHCFVSQTKTTTIVEQTATNRAKFWAGLLGAEWLLDLQDPIQTELQEVIELTAVDWTSDIDRLRQQLREATLSLQDAQTVIAIESRSLLDPEQLASFRNELSQVERIRTRRKDREAAQALLRRWQERRDRVENELKPKQREMVELEQAEALAKERARIEKINGEIDAAMAEYQEIQRKKPKPVPDAAIAPPEDNPEEAAEQDLRDKVGQLDHLLELYASGQTVCHECYQEIPRDEARHAAMQRDRDALAAELADISAQRKQWQAYEQQLLEHNLCKQAYAFDLERYEKWLRLAKLKAESLGKKLPLPPAKLTLSQIKTRKVATQTDIDELTEELNPAEVDQKIAVAEGRLEEIERELGATWISQTHESELAEKVTLHENAVQTVASLKQQAATAEGKIATTQAELKRVEQLHAKQLPLRTYREALERAKKRMRPSDLPSQILVAAAGGLIHRANNLCEQFGLEFQLQINDEFELMVRHHNGDEEPVQRLSCGQRACASIAIWLAKLTGCDTGIDILVLDEPSANVDSTGVRMFAEMLLSVGELLKSTQLQVWLTTHHMQLANCGQYHLDLG